MLEAFLLLIGRKERRRMLMDILSSKVHCVGKHVFQLLWCEHGVLLGRPCGGEYE